MIRFIIPVFNEEQNIERLLKNLSSYAESKKWIYKLYISDDGSRDDTVKIALQMKNKMPLEIVKSEINMGPGSAFDKGFKAILKEAGDNDIIVTMEADNTSDLDILEKMLVKTEEGNSVVLASCYAKEGEVKGTTFLRKILSGTANFLVKAMSRDKTIKTFSSFYRCYKASVLRKAYEKYGDKFIEEKGFVCAVEILIKLLRLDVKTAEVPMILRCDKRAGKSKMKIFKTTMSYFKLFFREAFK
ncbi:dolichol-phosphate mannosyltransferase [Candidatus Omnitrophus magneticus]|uniref:Dolichol-phosphate mannosyltransferase n=1 Tax=Candidatus Omnitrophus magneticus TaxID=1609969 RepID=A0A0F0CMC4_9BACT|nr:dolichol-phosphate mannosyltransferase [Candidatus Omnitrophus magneticus]